MSTAHQTLTLERATIYCRNGVLPGIKRFEVRDLQVELKSYAQYEDAVVITFIPKGKRNEREMVQTYQPDLVVLAGWGHDLEPDSIWGETRPSGTPGVSVTNARYRSQDPRWGSEFGEKLQAYLTEKGLTLAADYRGFHPQQRTYGAAAAA